MAVAGPMALSPECDAFREEFEVLSALADALVEPLSDEQFTWQPTPDSWSVALCIDHLDATAHSTCRSWTRASRMRFAAAITAQAPIATTGSAG